MITDEIKNQVVGELLAARENFAGTDAQYARMLGISSSIYSRIKGGERDRVLADPIWLTLARKYRVGATSATSWRAASTDVFEYLTGQFELCQRHSVSGIMCDEAGIGKTFAAEHYAATHRNVVYVDCSQVKTKHTLLRCIAKGFGINYIGNYTEVYNDLAYYLKTIDSPFIILDEAGDLKYNAFLELKALWNATERCCGWFMMGADGLKKKLERGRASEKVGFAELFDRYGKRFQRVTPLGGEEREFFMQRQAAMIIKANSPAADIQQMLANTDGSLRRIYTEITKVATNG